ncbi:placenta-expressed transcript 1 protein isoform X1 [Panthera tigris]|uniref:placenta-expressed transcript 1 protein isoform X1 n=1 Tax=Panthera tigris TaxID=9694 RepID=UPI001C6F8A5D|nr:placenta-expressed transcript 1 protein isoform X1 [Panthera tigris]
MTSRRSSNPGAYKEVSRRYFLVPGPAVSKPVKTMAVLGSTLLPLGLFLCFGLLCSSASSAGEIDKCMFFSEVTTTGPGIMVNSDVYDSNRNYTVWVPVNANISSVVLRAVDENNTSLGLWEKADELCNSSALYHLENLNDKLFTANWVSPNSENITTIELQAFAINFYNMATFSSLQLRRKEMTTSQISTTRTTPSPNPMTGHISTTRTTPSPNPMTGHISTTRTTPRPSPMTRHISTTRTTPRLTPRTTSLANKTFLCPITSAIQILIVFLTSKLLS